MDEAQNIQILLIEDDLFDVAYAKRGIQTHQLPVELVVVHDGQEALEFLEAQEKTLSEVPPLLLLLDLNMPRMNGFEFLEVYQKNHHMKKRVVFVLTHSNTLEDIERAQELGAAATINKHNFHWDPSDIKRLLTIFKKHINM